MVPLMTANDAPAPFVASCSSEYKISGSAFFPFANQAIHYSGNPTGVNCWIAIKLNRKYVLKQYSFICNTQYGLYPIDYKIQGSNDGESWYDVDTVVGNNNYQLTKNLDSLVAYSNYRIIGNSFLNNQWWCNKINYIGVRG